MPVNSDIHNIWINWTHPKKIAKWYTGNPQMYTDMVENDLTVGKEFCYTMKSLDNSLMFQFKGTYILIEEYKKLSFRMDDHRLIHTAFGQARGKTIITQEVEVESHNSLESQAIWWKTILSNFKNFVENQTL